MAYRTPSFSFGYGLTPWVKNLIIANTVIWVATYLLGVHQLTGWMAFVPGQVLFRPWTLITYMFAHGGFMHLFFNMLGLFFFGPPLEARWGSREFLKFYLICGLGGAALSFVFMDNAVIGASAAVYGVMLAFAMNWPDMPIYIWGIFPVPAKFLVLILALFSFVSAFSGSGGNVAHFAHLGGFAAAWLYLKYDRGRHRLFSGMRQKSQKRKFTVVPGDGGGRASGRNVETTVTSTPSRPAPRGRSDDQILDELDRVLEKISTDGLASLTSEERRLLDDVSRRYRQN